MERIGRNQPCPCGSGKKYKKCCCGKKNTSQIHLTGDFGKNLPEDVVITTDPQKEKMSEIFLEFAKPLLDKCKNETSINNTLQICGIAWNTSFLPPEERNELIDESFNKYITDNNEREMAKEILSKMLERKEKKFPDIKRMIMDFQILEKDGQRQLNVISSTNL